MGLIYSLLERLITVIYIRLKSKEFKVLGAQRAQSEVLRKKGGKNIPSLNENIPHLEGKRGGGTESLNKKKSTPGSS